ncbi:MAG TPA: PDZ domain-containing protein, partial [Bacteroidia bacterium]
LRDLMLILYNDYYKNGKGYTEQDILGIIHHISGKDFDNFFKKYVYGLDEYEEELNHCFAYLGLRLHKHPSHAFYERHIGFKATEHGLHKKITMIVPYSAAWKAGLSINDEIVAVNGYQLKNDLHQWLNYFYKKGSEIRLTVLSNHTFKEIVCVVDPKKEYFPHYRIEHVDNATENAKNNYIKWKLSVQ